MHPDPESDLKALQWALRRGLRKGGPDSSFAVAAMQRVADALKQQRRYAEEILLRQQILAALRKNLGEDDDLVLHAELSLGICLCRLQRFDEAQPSLTQVAADMEVRLGPDDPNRLTAIRWIAHIMKSDGRLEEARSMEEQVVVRYEMRGNGESEQALAAFTNLADINNHLDHVDEAVRIYRHVLDVRGRTLGPDDPKTLASLQDLASVLYMNRRDLPEAKVMARSLIEKRTRLLGADDENTVKALGLLDSIEALE